MYAPISSLPDSLRQALESVSYHLKALLDAGVIDREKQGRWSYYSLNPDRFGYLTGALSEYGTGTTATG